MREYEPSRPLVSIHIPKCGGTSFSDILKGWFGSGFYRHYFNEEHNLMPESHPLGPGICIHGHFNRKRGFGVQDYYPDIDQFISIIRDPFEIIVSRYFFEKKKEKKRRSFRDGRRLELIDDINKYLDEEIQKPDYHPNILDYMPFETTFDNYKEVINECFVYIGVTDDFGFSVNSLAEKLNFSALSAGHLNKSDRYKGFSADLRERFIDLHPLVYTIYNYVLDNYRKW